MDSPSESQASSMAKELRKSLTVTVFTVWTYNVHKSKRQLSFPGCGPLGTGARSLLGHFCRSDRHSEHIHNPAFGFFQKEISNNNVPDFLGPLTTGEMNAL
jgi:hypothetical protein